MLHNILQGGGILLLVHVNCQEMFRDFCWECVQTNDLRLPKANLHWGSGINRNGAFAAPWGQVESGNLRAPCRTRSLFSSFRIEEVSLAREAILIA